MCLGAGTGEALSKSYSVIVNKYSSKFPAEKTSSLCDKRFGGTLSDGRTVPCLAMLGRVG